MNIDCWTNLHDFRIVRKFRFIFQNHQEVPGGAPSARPSGQISQPNIRMEGNTTVNRALEALPSSLPSFSDLKSQVEDLIIMREQESGAGHGQLNPGSNSRSIENLLHGIVVLLNKELRLGLENPWLDIDIVEGNLVIEFDTDRKIYTNEYSPSYYNSDDKSRGRYVNIIHNDTSTKIFIKPDFSVERYVTDNSTGQTIKIEQ